MRRIALTLATLLAQPIAPVFAAESAPAQAAPVDPARRAAAQAFAESIDLRKQLTMANEIAAGQIESSLLRELLESNPKAQAARKKNPERFEKVILASGEQSADELKKSLLTAVKKFTRNRPPEDDQTLVVVAFDDAPGEVLARKPELVTVAAGETVH